MTRGFHANVVTVALDGLHTTPFERRAKVFEIRVTA
jgi:hypothetical protein